jgi:hypothetical protein
VGFPKPVTPFNATESLLTFGSNIGDSVVLRAYQGSWLVVSTLTLRCPSEISAHKASWDPAIGALADNMHVHRDARV